MNMFDEKMKEIYNNQSNNIWREHGREGILRRSRYRSPDYGIPAGYGVGVYEGELFEDVALRTGWRGIRTHEESSGNLSSIAGKSEGAYVDYDSVLFQINSDPIISKEEVLAMLDNKEHSSDRKLLNCSGDEQIDWKIEFRRLWQNNVFRITPKNNTIELHLYCCGGVIHRI
ncbi:MAG: hypothetical protein ACQEWA_06755 [Sphaerochaetaceae bacterium]